MKNQFIVLLFALSNSIVAFSQNHSYEVYALKFTSEATIPSAMVAIDAPKTDSVTAVFMFWLIKGKNGKNILVDAGFHKDVEEAKEIGFTNYVRPDSMLLRLGMKATDISDIILSHPHWDHIDGIDLFPNAQVGFGRTTTIILWVMPGKRMDSTGHLIKGMFVNSEKII